MRTDGQRYAIGAETAYVYIRGEYVTAIRRMDRRSPRPHENGYLGHRHSSLELQFHGLHSIAVPAPISAARRPQCSSHSRASGAAATEAAVSRRGRALRQPTVINNVETLACVPHIVMRGPGWFRGIGPDRSPGPKLYCLSGQVRKPGLYELPMGISLHELVEEHAGGPLPGRKVRR